MSKASPSYWPRPIRLQARCCRARLLALRRSLIACCPDGSYLARDRSYAERFTTYPEDHVVADVIAAARVLILALDDLDNFDPAEAYRY
jgi:hypothetical protein